MTEAASYITMLVYIFIFIYLSTKHIYVHTHMYAVLGTQSLLLGFRYRMPSEKVDTGT